MQPVSTVTMVLDRGVYRAGNQTDGTIPIDPIHLFPVEESSQLNCNLEFKKGF